jgi:hypothetical protein
MDFKVGKGGNEPGNQEPGIGSHPERAQEVVLDGVPQGKVLDSFGKVLSPEAFSSFGRVGSSFGSFPNQEREIRTVARAPSGGAIS